MIRTVVLYVGLISGFLCCSCSIKNNADQSCWFRFSYMDASATIHFHFAFRTTHGEHSFFGEAKYFSDGTTEVSSGVSVPYESVFTSSTAFVKYWDDGRNRYVVHSNNGTGWKEYAEVDSDFLLSSLFKKKYADVSFSELNEKTVREGTGIDETYSVSIGASPVVGDVMRNDAALVSVDKDNVSDCYLADYDGTRWNFVRVSDGYAMEQRLSGCDVMLLRWGNDYIPCVTATKYDYDLTGYLKYDAGTDSFSYAAFSEGYRKIFKVLAGEETPFNCEPVIASDGRVHYIIYNGDAFTASYVIYDPASATPETPVWEKKLF